MHLADQATPQELRLKGSPSGKNYNRPPGPAAASRIVRSSRFDGRVLITRSSTRMPRSVTAIWSMCAARHAPEQRGSVTPGWSEGPTTDVQCTSGNLEPGSMLRLAPQ